MLGKGGDVQALGLYEAQALAVYEPGFGFVRALLEVTRVSDGTKN
jgi:hypothetical protein